jgi:hypothetical protein
MIPPYVLLFVWGRHPDPDRSDPWGWCPGAVLSGVTAGVFIGAFFGPLVGLLKDLIFGSLSRGSGDGERGA